MILNLARWAYFFLRRSKCLVQFNKEVVDDEQCEVE